MSRMKPMIVGEASNLRVGEPPMSGRTGEALARMAGLSLAELHAEFDRVNLLKRWPGRSGGIKGHRFDPAKAKRAARRLDLRGRTVVLAGKRVAKAFGLTDPPWLVKAELGRGELAAFVIPHPSGIVQWYNCPRNRAKVGRLLRRLLRSAESSARG